MTEDMSEMSDQTRATLLAAFAMTLVDARHERVFADTMHATYYARMEEALSAHLRTWRAAHERAAQRASATFTDAELAAISDAERAVNAIAGHEGVAREYVSLTHLREGVCTNLLAALLLMQYSARLA